MLNGETKMGDLADQLGMDKSTLSRNFTLLEDRGLVSRMALDGRTVGISITAAGQETLEDICSIWREVQDEVLKDVGMDNWMDALGVLKRMTGENSRYAA
jgi:DNA-binding MarR family transcriptional regulator